MADEYGTQPLSEKDVQDVIDQVTYKPGYDFDLEIEGEDGDEVWWITLTVRRPDAITGVMGIGHGRARDVYPHMTVSQIVRTMFGMVMAYEEHECREFFKLRDRAVFGPHVSVDSLWDAALDTD